MTDLRTVDRFAEPAGDGPYWNENSWFSFSVPERRIHGLVQHLFRPNMRLMLGGPAWWDASGTSQWNCLYYNWSHLQAIPPGAGKYDVRARNSLDVRMEEPLARYRIGYDLDGVTMDLTWTAVAPPHAMHTGDAQQQQTAAFHFMQPGRMTGTITRHGEAMAIDCWSMRDGSSGNYDTETWPTGGYFWGMSERGAFLTLCFGKAAVLPTLGGFLRLDGETAELAGGTRTVLEYGPHGPSRVRWEGRDVRGRTLAVEGRIDPGLVFTGYTDHTTIWSLAEWRDADGGTWWGDSQEFYPSEDFRRIARGEITLGG